MSGSGEWLPYGPLVETTVRVATWNLWWRFGPWEDRQPAIIETLRRVEADIVCLQEVWVADGESQADLLAADLEMTAVFDSRLERDGVEFGNAVLSRWPIVDHETRPYDDDQGTNEHRIVLRADVDGPRGVIQVFCTHLNWRLDHSATRQDQVRQLARFVTESRPRTHPPVVCGDFNANPDSDEIRMMTGRSAVGADRVVFIDAWEAAGVGDGLTWSNENPFASAGLEPDRRIDYIFSGWPKAGGLGHVLECRLAGVEPIEGVWGSDHYAVVADLRY